MNLTNSTANQGVQKETDINKTATGRDRDEVSRGNIERLGKNNGQPMTMQEAFEYARKQWEETRQK